MLRQQQLQPSRSVTEAWKQQLQRPEALQGLLQGPEALRRPDQQRLQRSVTWPWTQRTCEAPLNTRPKHYYSLPHNQ